ncbi:ATP-binding protein [Myxococcota bacterium]
MSLQLRTETRRYALYGALFGLCFPVGATFVLALQDPSSGTLASIVTAQRHSYLLWIIDTAPLFLGAFAALAGIRQDRLLEVLAAREETIWERTRGLALANQSTKELLDNMQQAVFTVGQGGRVNPEYSAYTGNLFRDTPIAGVHLLDLLQVTAKGPTEAGLRMKSWLELILGSDELQWLMTRGEAISALEYERANQAGEVERRFLQLEYAPVFREGLVDKVMVVAKDVTDFRRLERDVLQKERELALVAEIASIGHTTLQDFLSDAGTQLSQSVVDYPAEPSQDLSTHWLRESMRGVHTIKGNARMCGVKTVESAAHNVEQSLLALSSRRECRDPEAEARKALLPLTEALAAVEAMVARIFDLKDGGYAKQQGQAATKTPAAFRQLESAYARLSDCLATRKEDVDGVEQDAMAELRAAVLSLCTAPLSDLWPHLQKMIDDLSVETGKNIRLSCKGGEVNTSYSTRGAARDILVHALRNSIDHGIESPDLRRSAGKPPEATLCVVCSTDEEKLQITVRDDGAGIDTGLLKRKCAERKVVPAEKLDSLSDAEILDLIFLPGFSTTEKVTAISGRGAGMDIIRAIAERNGGSAHVTSVPRQGTELVCRLARMSHSWPLNEERRQSPRKSVYLYLLVRDRDGAEFGRLIDASIGGMMIAHTQSTRVGEVHEVSVCAPERLEGFSPVSMRLTCRWTNAAPTRRGHISGFALDPLSETQLRELDRVISKFAVSGEGLLSFPRGVREVLAPVSAG